jgi:hypothetical protein
MDIQVPLPLDQHGFLRRECPHCGRQFKWHHGPANEEAETAPTPPAYHCPLCGQPARMDSWFTQQQAAFIQGSAMPGVMRELQRELKGGFRPRSRGSGIRFEFKGGEVPDVPPALTEPDDMQIVASPCHAYEPVKVPDDLTGPFYCLVCGDRFAI